MAEPLTVISLVMLVLSLLSRAIAPECSNCGCCVDKYCALKGSTAEYCIYGCIDGISGFRCYNKCPDACVTCEQENKQNCKTCVVGRYLNNNKRCVDCPTKCEKCTSLTQCQECHPPYTNAGSVTDCSCRGNCKCFTSGICTSCLDGFFNTNNYCNSSCPVNCKKCSDFLTCQMCRNGFYNGRKYDLSNGTEVTDCSLTCRYNCRECLSFNECTICKKGFYGKSCEKSCSKGCTNNECRTDGSCVCKSNFVGSKCTECTPGQFGDLCEKLCLTSNCFGNKCDRDTGECVSCAAGYYGKLCEQNCSQGCLTSDCDTKTGACRGCKSTFSGDRCCLQGGDCLTCSSNKECRICAEGYYGTKCNLPCPEACPIHSEESQCERDSGICKTCDDGFHGDYCNLSCSANCLNHRCTQNNGHCFDGCSGAFDGPTCTQYVTKAVSDENDPVISATLSVMIVILVIVVVAQCIVIKRRFARDYLTNLMKTKEGREVSPVPPAASINDSSTTYESVLNVPNDSVYNVLEEDRRETASVHRDTVQYINTRMNQPL